MGVLGVLVRLVMLVFLDLLDILDYLDFLEILVFLEVLVSLVILLKRKSEKCGVRKTLAISNSSLFTLFIYFGLFLLECEGQGWTVTNLCWAEVLDWARVNEACVASPLSTMTNEVLVRLA